MEKNIWQRFKDEEFQALGVEIWDGGAADVNRFFVGLTKTTYPVLLKGGRVGAQYGVDRATYMVMDQEGIVRYRSEGRLGQRYDEETLISVIQILLTPANTPPRIVNPIPDQDGVGINTIRIDLEGFVEDTEEGPANLNWHAEGFDPELIIVGGQMSAGPLKFTPRQDALGQNFNILLIVTDSKGATAEQEIALHWARLQAVLSISSEDLNFGDVFVGSSQTLKLKVSNEAASDGEDLTVDLASVSPTFSVPGSSVTVPAGESREISIVYRPTEAISSSGELTFLTNDPNRESFGVSLTGVGLTPLELQVAVSDTDFDGDGRIDFDDFFLFAGAFGGMDPLFDLDRSGRVDLDDFFIFATDFGKMAKDQG